MSPGVNLFIYSVFAAAIFLVRDLTAHLIISSCVVFALFFIPFKKVRGGFLPIAVFLGFTFISNLFYQTGRVLYMLGSVAVTDEGLRIASIRTLRVFDMIFAAKVLTALTPLEDMLGSLKKLSAPLQRIGVPVHDFFSATALTLKAFPALKKRLQAAYSESVEGKGAVRFSEKIRLAVSFLMPVFVESMRNPEKFFVQNEAEDKRDA